MKVEIIAPNPKILDELNTFCGMLYQPRQHVQVGNWKNVEHVILVRKNHELMGFLTTFSNPYLSKYLIAGNYQCVPNPEVSTQLFDALKSLAIQTDITSIIGPMNGSTWHSYRYSNYISNPFFMEYVHKDYYVEQWKNAGFLVCETYCSNTEQFDPLKQFLGMDEFLTEKELTTKKFGQEQLIDIHGFCNQVFSKNPLFSPISLNEFLELYTPLLPYFDPNLIDLIYDQNQLVGLLLAIADPKDPSTVIVKTIARHPDKKYNGLATVLSNRFYKKAVEMHFQTMIHAYMHLENSSTFVSKKYGGSVFKEHILFEYDLKRIEP
ncbi:MAG: hypothetical protein H6607_11200 [Flavobacteriales bacterium]|nr:hypothetical protein [Flavobacteriales bacterium]